MLFFNNFAAIVNKNLLVFTQFWLATVTQKILGYSLFCDQNQDGISFQDVKGDIWAINEAVVQTNTKKVTNFGLSVFTGW